MHVTEKQSAAGSGVEVKKRKLGDEWNDWDGKLESQPRVKTYSKLFFIIFFMLSSLLLIAAINFVYYMIYPRLQELFDSLTVVFNLLRYGLSLLLALILVGSALLSFVPWRIFSVKVKKVFFIKNVFFLAVRTARFFGVSRDGIYASFIKFSNSLMKVFSPRVEPGAILILIPRCVEKNLKNSIKEMGESYGVHVAVATGGEEARKKVKELRPRTVIGIACERDLFTGINDVSLKVNVFGICNTRPEGPCLNTQIDMQELETMIRDHIKN